MSSEKKEPKKDKHPEYFDKGLDRRPDPKLEAYRVNLKGLFTKGFESDQNWISAKELALPADVKFLGVTEGFETQYGTTNRYAFETEHGQKVSLLCKGKTFLRAVKGDPNEGVPSLPLGKKISLYKNEKGFWEFDLA